PASTDIYTPSLHDALPICLRESGKASKTQRRVVCVRRVKLWKCSGETMRYLVRLTDRALRDMHAIYEFIEAEGSETRLHGSTIRSEEHTSELQSPDHLVCR